MIQALREQASSWVIKILLGLLVISFAIWGINDVFLGDRDPAVAEVGDVKIPRSQAEDAVREEINRLRPLFGRQLDRDRTFRAEISNQVLARLVDQTAMDIGARSLGIIVSDQMANRAIRTDQTFFNSQGQFDRGIFAQALAQSSQSEGRYVATLKQRLSATQLSGAVAGTIPLPKAMLEPMVKFRSERRRVRYVEVPLPDVKSIADPATGAVETYYKANTARFTAPEYRNISFIHLDPATLAAEVRVPEAEIKKSYEERIEEFTIRDRRKVVQVVFRTKAAADAAAAAIAKGTKMAKAAREGGKPVKPVVLGWVEKSDMFNELAEPVFALAKGKTSAPIKTSLGWHVVSVEDVQAGRVKPLGEVRAIVKKAIATREALDGIFALANKLEDSLAGGAAIDEAASSLNLKAAHIRAVDSSGLDPAGKTIPVLPKSSSFLRVAFQTESGEDSPLTETEGGGFYILHVNSIAKPAVQPLAKVRKEAVLAWKTEQRIKKSAARAEKILESLKKGGKLKTVAGKEKLKLHTSKAFSRLTHDAESGLPTALMEKVFAIKKGEGAMAPSPKGHMVAVLFEVRRPDEKEKVETETRAQDEIRKGITADLFEQMVGAFKNQVTIRTWPDRLQNRP